MNTTQLIENALARATGKYKTITPADSKWKPLLASANILIDAWASEPGERWQSLYNPNYPSGQISNTDTYDIDREVYAISDDESDHVRIRDKDNPNLYYDYTLVPPYQLKRFNAKVCAKAGQSIVFNKVFTETDPEFGGTLLLPVYVRPKHLSQPNSIVPVDDPNWLVLTVAAEYARTKRTLNNQYPLLLSEAQAAMQGMKDANGAQAAYVLRGPVVRATEW